MAAPFGLPPHSATSTGSPPPDGTRRIVPPRSSHTSTSPSGNTTGPSGNSSPEASSVSSAVDAASLTVASLLHEHQLVPFRIGDRAQGRPTAGCVEGLALH